MKQTATEKAAAKSSPRKRFEKVVRQAKASGENLPRRLDVIGFRHLTLAERNLGKKFGALARKCLQKSNRAAA